jgi:Ca2+-binding RTX toxin-like protein
MGGDDTLTGGAGDDTYVVEDAADVVTEAAAQGTDTVRAGVSFTLALNVENLVLTGTAGINGTGNALANVITGNAAANVLTGGLGNDTSVVGVGDSVVELVGRGTDTVQSAVAGTLGANLENLTLTGTAAVAGTGNALANQITGNAVSNTLDGLGGNDLLQGLGGNDVLRNLTGRSAMEGGTGADTLQVGGNAFLAGGLGNDRLELGASGAQIVAYNAGEGLDTLVGSGARNDTLSLGKVLFADLHFTRTANDLSLSTAVGQGLVLKDWFVGQQTVSTLQMVIDGTSDYDPAATDVLHNSKVVSFDFAALAAQFTQQGATPGWAVLPALAGAQVEHSDTAAVGGQLATVYAHDGALAAAAPLVLSVIGAAEFGALQALVA